MFDEGDDPALPAVYTQLSGAGDITGTAIDGRGSGDMRVVPAHAAQFRMLCLD